MATSVSLGGITYIIPAYNDQPVNWAQGSGNLSTYLIALAAQIATTPAFMQTVSATSSPITVATGKTYLTATSGGAITFNLPTPAANTWLMIKDISGLASTNNMTLHRNGSELIDGVAADVALNINNGLTIVACDGTNWFILLQV